MQYSTLLVSAAIAASAGASPLNLFRRQEEIPTTTVAAHRFSDSARTSYAGYSVESGFATPSATAWPSEAPYASSVATDIPISESVGLSSQKEYAGKYFDGVSYVSQSMISLIFTPVQKTLTISKFEWDNTAQELVPLSCPKSGDEYETIRSNLLSSMSRPIQVHGGNLCTSNILQYYMWASRMYEGLWFTYGSFGIDAENDYRCEITTGTGTRGEVIRCLVPNYSPTVWPSPTVSGRLHTISDLPYASGFPRVSGVPYASDSPRVSGVEPLFYPQASRVPTPSNLDY